MKIVLTPPPGTKLVAALSVSPMAREVTVSPLLSQGGSRADFLFGEVQTNNGDTVGMFKLSVSGADGRVKLQSVAVGGVAADIDQVGKKE